MSEFSLRLARCAFQFHVLPNVLPTAQPPPTTSFLHNGRGTSTQWRAPKIGESSPVLLSWMHGTSSYAQRAHFEDNADALATIMSCEYAIGFLTLHRRITRYNLRSAGIMARCEFMCSCAFDWILPHLNHIVLRDGTSYTNTAFDSVCCFGSKSALRCQENRTSFQISSR